ncbi:MAG: hypothetical protein L0Y72_22510 [Gemmataceae bacterium]|nr:hypothetical protein [Gemmataceae bacterium]
MSKQRNMKPNGSLGDPSLDHASALIQEYTRKLRAMSRRSRDVRKECLAANQRRLKLSSAIPNKERNHSPEEQHLWFEIMDEFRSRHDEYVTYLHALLPQAKKLAQHVSQLITHGTEQTIVQIELSLRVAELESAIEAAKASTNSNLAFQVP